VNTSALEAVASMDRDGNFYFVSNRSYDRTASTLYRGKFADGGLTGIKLVPGASLAKPGIVNFDAEISADGNTLYFVESEFSWLGKPKSARILFARRDGAAFVRDPASGPIMASINANGLNYAPATSTSAGNLLHAGRCPGASNLHLAARREISPVRRGPPSRSRLRVCRSAVALAGREVSLLSQARERPFRCLRSDSAIAGTARYQGWGPSPMGEKPHAAPGGTHHPLQSF